jgi:hypothetical protein
VDRETLRASTFAGNCTVRGYRDGDDALFNYPRGIIKDPHLDDKVIVTDSGNHAIRQIDINTRITTTLLKGSVYSPYQIVYDAVTDTFLISSSYAISRYDSNTNVITVVSGGGSLDFSDGDLSQAKFYHPSNLIVLNERATLVADFGNALIRVLDFENSTVSSVCIPQLYAVAVTEDGSAKSCKLDGPIGLLYREGVLYVGQSKVIRTIPCE